MIEVFGDIWCPFTHLSLRKLVAARDEGRFSGVLRVRSWPLELVNGQPLNPSFVAEEVDELRRQIDSSAFAGFDADRFPETMLAALRLNAIAYDHGVEVGETVALELRHRLFELGEDVSDGDVLDDVAAAHGLDVGATPASSPEDDWAEGKRRGVEGSPHFFTPGGDFFSPSFDVEKVNGQIRVRANPAGFDRLVASIAGPAAAQS